VQARMTDAATGEVLWTTSLSVGIEDGDLLLQQSRLAGGLGYPLALRINALSSSVGSPAGNAKIVVEQATAFINQSTIERFQAAEAMLEQALAREPDSVDVRIALAAHRLRGIQSSWYPDADMSKQEASAEAMLLGVLQAKPSYVPALGGYCRLLTATNRFVDSLVACAKTLGFDPWDGTALFQLGMTQIRLGRFEEALATFKEADQYDTPRVSRWTWLLGAGWACLLLDRNEEALRWLQQSIAITPGTGRSFGLLAVAYQRLGRQEEAKAALAKLVEIRPGSTARNAQLPTRNASPVFLGAEERIIRSLEEIGLPEG
jgi:tetratricopeptide (TPR) repeat protein